MMCSIEGCDRPAKARGWCLMHWKRWKRNGDPEAIVRFPYGEGLEHFFAHVAEPTDGCRIWPYSKNWAGYGLITICGERRFVHRETCVRWHGPCPEGKGAAHSCGNPSCWAGEHLRWATAAENAADMVGHGRSTRGERDSQTKLTPEQVMEIRARYDAGGVTYRSLAAEYGVSKATIGDVRTKSWRWL